MKLRGDPDRQRSGADCGGFTQQAPAFAGGGVSADFAYVAESHVIDVKKIWMLTICTRICTCKPAICVCAAEPDLENPQVCSDQRAELVYESIAVLDLVLEERSAAFTLRLQNLADSLKSCRS